MKNQATKYQEALDWLYTQLPMFSRVGGAAYKAGLETSEALDSYFGHPHTHYKTIHVGGTNGKGSSSNMIAAILQSAGYKTGLYTSPHLADFRERIRVNGQKIPKERVIKFVEEWREGGFDGHTSFFELTMALAFCWMAEEQVDVAVIEVGMGGRLDSTNIITPDLSLITNISKDHTQFLGDTLEKIAAEKAGIIKTGIPSIIGEAGNNKIKEVFLTKADEAGSEIFFAEEAPLLSACIENEEGGFDCETISGLKFHSPLSGDYQKKNINTVLKSIEILRELGYRISDENIIEGMENVNVLTGFYGRWSILLKNPLTIADTGHNEAGLRYNMAQLERLISLRPDGVLRIVAGFVADKDITNILGLFPENAIYYFTQASIPRALDAHKLQLLAGEHGLKGKVIENVRECYNSALAESGKDDILYIGGSTFVVAEVIDSDQ